MSNGKVICLVGETGSGKTTYVKEWVSKSKKELIAYCRIREDIGMKGKIYTNFLDFIEEANTKKDSHIFIDEAFTCLPKRLNIKPDKPENIHNQIADFLVNSRKLNNFVWILYHSLSQVPTDWIIPYLNYFVRFQTNDQLNYQLTRFSSFPNITNSLINYPTIDKFDCDEIKIR